MINNCGYFNKKQHRFCSSFPFFSCAYFARFLAFNFNSFFVQLCYFLILSLLGYLGLKASKLRTSVSPTDFDLFYTSVSASTVSSMVAIEMELFSNSQLILLIFLMFLGGEVFTSMLHLLFARYNLKFTQTNINTHTNRTTNSLSVTKEYANQIELGLVSSTDPKFGSQNNKHGDGNNSDISDRLMYNSLRYLIFVVLGYLLVSHVVGFTLVSSYIALIPSARQVLKNKGIKMITFSLFTIVSTFASCGFIPTNENMMVFKKNSGLLLLIMPYIFLGNTLYPACLRVVIMVLERVTRREELSYLLKNNCKDIGYDHFLSPLHCCLLVATVFGFNIIQFVIFCSMEWSNSKIMEGLNMYEKVVASLFQVTNARHAGESVFDLSSLSSAILVLFVVMMYLPPYTTFLPTRDHQNDVKRDQKSVVECLVFSQLSYLAIFIILICITESKSLKEDPLNFNVLNITLEVISAYGNVGFSTGYSCERRLIKAERRCEDSWVGFSGRWSNKGKFILILVMFFGRLKKFNMRGGKAWDLS